MKQCNKCNQVKPYTEFHKRTYKGVQGYQYRCKICQNKYTTRYRKFLRPDYWNCKDGYFSHRKNWEYILDYRKADKDITIYLMKVKDCFYVGFTKAYLNVRLSIHKADYKNQRPDKPVITNLHAMWDTMSADEIEDAILTTIVLETKPGPRYLGYKLEKKWIKDLSNRGYKLLNRNHNIRQA